MSEEFDPYYRWLGIPPDEQPPNHYRLLGLRPMEGDVDVIGNAADRQMNYVRTFQMGRRGELAEQILNEIAVAKVCLLSATQKAEYDRRLTAALEAVGASEASHSTGAASAAVPSAASSPAVPPDAPPEAPPQRIIVDTSDSRVAAAKGSSPGEQKSWLRASTRIAIVLIGLLIVINGGIYLYGLVANGDDDNSADNTDNQDATIGGEVVPAGEMPRGPNQLAALDLESAQVSGEWLRDGSGVRSDRARYAKLRVPVELPASYTVALAVKRLNGTDALSVTLPVGGARCTIVLDGRNASRSGIDRVNEVNYWENPNAYKRRVFATSEADKEEKKYVVLISVTPNRIAVHSNGQSLLEWSGDSAELSMASYWDTADKTGLLLGTNRSSFVIENLVIVNE